MVTTSLRVEACILQEEAIHLEEAEEPILQEEAILSSNLELLHKATTDLLLATSRRDQLLVTHQGRTLNSLTDHLLVIHQGRTLISLRDHLLVIHPERTLNRLRDHLLDTHRGKTSKSLRGHLLVTQRDKTSKSQKDLAIILEIAHSEWTRSGTNHWRAKAMPMRESRGTTEIDLKNDQSLWQLALN
jgi:hypothetical protein